MSKNLIIGTLGHIDHGKTSLIKALNGFWGDSQAQEKERGITLDLSFSNLTNGDKNIAFIDVPGHEKLVKNMIAGAFGMDYAMLVVACNEGIMPQTKEHLYIASLLGIDEIIVVLSKSDLVDFKEKEKLKVNIIDFLKKFKGVKYEFLECSIYDAKQVENLKKYLFSLDKKQKVDLGFFRCYLDRVFSLKGVGCVVSGTILSGELSLESKVWCCNLNKSLGLKSIQVHNKSVDKANISQRVALNLSGVTHNELKRGDLLAQKGYLRGFDSVDVGLSFLEKIEHNSELQLFIGSLKMGCRVLLLDEKYATLKLKEPIFAIFGEKFILRNDSQTLGGGVVLNPIADPMKKAQKLQYLKMLDLKDFKGAFEILLQAHKKGFGLISATQRFALSQNEALKIAKELACKMGYFLSEKSLVLYSKESEKSVENKVDSILKKNQNALLSASLLSQKQAWICEEFAEFVLKKMLDEKKLTKRDSFYVLPQFSAKNIQDFLSEKIYAILEKQGFAPQAPYNLYDDLDIDRKTGDEAYKKLTQSKKIIRLNHKIFITSKALSELLEMMRNIIKKDGFLELNNFKEKLNLSRKYLIAYLDFLDSFEDIVNLDGKRFFKKGEK